MPTIRIDDQVWRKLQERAQPFVDSPNDVLRKLLGLSGKSNAVFPTAPAVQTPLTGKEDGKATPDIEFRRPILQCLVRNGGRGAVREIIEAVGQEMGPRLTLKDKERLKSGPVRWQSAAKWERQHMVMDGLLKIGSPRGIWEITEQGTRLLEG